MGWEIFYQAILILTSIHLIEFKSKGEGNCNVIIMGPADYGLHVIFLITAMSSSSYCFIVVMTLFSLYRLGHKSVLAFSGTEVLRIACEPKQFDLIVDS